MSDTTEPIAPPPEKGRLVSFSGTVSFGNVLILLGMISTGIVGIFTVGSSVQKLQDAINHEEDQRSSAVRELTAQISTVQREASNSIVAMQQREANDVSNITDGIKDLRSDVRSLLQASMPAPRR